MIQTLLARKYLVIATCFFLLYVANVFSGMNAGSFHLGVVAEFLLLLASCVFFTIDILRAESETSHH